MVPVKKGNNGLILPFTSVHSWNTWNCHVLAHLDSAELDKCNTRATRRTSAQSTSGSNTHRQFFSLQNTRLSAAFEGELAIPFVHAD